MKQFILCSFMLVSAGLYAQELPLVTDKPGTFEILSRTDYIPSQCGFSKSDVESNLQRIKDLVTAVRKNPILTDIKGFNGRARIHAISMCNYKEQYGGPSLAKDAEMFNILKLAFPSFGGNGKGG